MYGARVRAFATLIRLFLANRLLCSPRSYQSFVISACGSLFGESKVKVARVRNNRAQDNR